MRRPATRTSTEKTAPQRYAPTPIGSSAQSAMSPGNGTRPSAKAECTLGTKRSTKGPTSASKGAGPPRALTSTTFASGTPAARHRCTHEGEPYTVAPLTRAAAGTSRQWSKCVCPATMASARGSRCATRTVSLRNGPRAQSKSDARVTYGSMSTV
jgi:hypothetical protein